MDIRRLVLFGCAHSGSRASNIHWLIHYAKMLEEPNTFGLSLGDLFENAIPSRGQGMMWDQSLTPEEQMEELCSIFYPVRKKFIGACTSNHSERTWKEVGINLDRLLWQRMGVPQIYRGLEGTCTFAGKRIAFAHGLGHGTNEWGDARKLLAIYPTVDIVAVSHRHEMASKWYGNFEVDRRGTKHPRWVLFARTGGLMEWARYARRELYTPQKPGFTVLYFPNDGSVRTDTNGLPDLMLTKNRLDKKQNRR